MARPISCPSYSSGDDPRQRTPLSAYDHEWGRMVGERVRHLRTERGLSLRDFGSLVRRPDGGYYSHSYFSKLERGIAYAPLFVYVRIAEALAIEPGRLLGLDDRFTESEAMLIDAVRRAGIEPSEAIVRVLATRPGETPSTRD
jgi:transcriptional regulator with XRE-family HTH domain